MPTSRLASDPLAWSSKTKNLTERGLLLGAGVPTIRLRFYSHLRDHKVAGQNKWPESDRPFTDA